MKFLRIFIINLASILGFLFPGLFLQKRNFKKSRLTIYNLHSTSVNHFSKYQKLLSKINSKEKFLNPENLDDFFNKEYGEESFSLLTLDDGSDNNYFFAEDVLKNLNIKAIFFIIPSFITYKKNSINSDFFNVLHPENKDNFDINFKQDFKPLSLKEIKKMQILGHTIGMHGFNHENFGNLTEDEIINCLKEGIKTFNENQIKIKHFAYPFGHKNSFNNKSNKIIKKYFEYIHLGIRGFNFNNNNDKLLKRHPLATYGKDLKYFPISYKEIYFFTRNRISLFINLFYET
tara:strand:+ start:254 stop:1120 length:867 start_codon:yes stop_codon:yes gene_type:complete